jgi:DNA-binding MarR family transcriptional regulator
MLERKRAKGSAAKPRPSAALRRTAQLVRSGKAAINLGALNDHLGYFVRRIQVWVFQDFIRALASVDISPAQFSVLVVIGANPGLSQAELSETLAIERARLVRLLHRLDRRGLTQRLKSSDDRRTHALYLTREGQKMLARAKALAAQHEARLVQKLRPEHYNTVADILRDF